MPSLKVIDISEASKDIALQNFTDVCMVMVGDKFVPKSFKKNVQGSIGQRIIICENSHNLYQY